MTAGDQIDRHSLGARFIVRETPAAPRLSGSSLPSFLPPLALPLGACHPPVETTMSPASALVQTVWEAQTLHLYGDCRKLHDRKKPRSDGISGEVPPSKGIQSWPQTIGVYVRIVNGGKLNRRQRLATRRWAYAARKTSSPSSCAFRAIVAAPSILQVNPHALQVRVPLLQLRRHNVR